MTIKQKIFLHYLQICNIKIAVLQQTLVELKESGSNETKSTAGDKHETALAMLQIEQTNKRLQLQQAQEQKVVIEKLETVINTIKIVHGSLVKTNKGYFYISVALGKTIIEDSTVIALSPQSPLGAKLMGLSLHSNIEMNGTEYLIENIY